MTDHSSQPQNQPPTFRRQETQRLLNWVRHGESALVVGVSGVGKSNLFRHLLDPAVQAAELGEAAAATIIARVNLHYAPDFSDRAVYSLILDALEELANAGHPALAGLERARLGELHDRLLDVGDDPLKIQRAVRQALSLVLADPQRRLGLLFDQFDDLYRAASPRLFMNLRGLREAFKYRLAFVFFTRDVLDNLAPPDPARDELHELVATQTLGLAAGDRAAAEDLLSRVAARRGLAPGDLVVDRLFAVSGGHAGLLRAAYLSSENDATSLRPLVRGAEPIEALAVALLNAPSVERECRQIWHSLSLDEQSYLAALVTGAPPEPPPAAPLANLRLKGLVVGTGAAHIFAPILAAYVARQPAVWREAFVYDQARRKVIIHGRQIDLTPVEAGLMQLLWTERHRLVTRDELITAGWPEDHKDISYDGALNTQMSRLRNKIEPDSDNPRYLITRPGVGYQLVVPSADPN